MHSKYSLSVGATVFIFCNFLFVNTAEAAAITSGQTGNWADTSTWVGGVVPGNGDTAIIANGHTVTIPAATSVIVGTSPADDVSTPAIACSSATGTGILVINGNLNFRGTVTQCNSIWTVGPGAVIKHDSSQASTPSTANYTWKIGMAVNQIGSKLIATGTEGNRITFTIETDSGRAGGWQGGTITWQDAGQVQCYYCDILHWGTSAGQVIRAYPYTGSVSDTRGVVFENTVMDDCGKIIISNATSNTTARFYNFVYKNPLNASTVRQFEVNFQAIPSTNATGGDRRIENAWIESQFSMGSSASLIVDSGWVLKNVIIAGSIAANVPPYHTAGSRNSFTAGNWDLVWLENRITTASDIGGLPGGTLQRTISTRNITNNPHHFFLSAINTTIDGFIAQMEFATINDGGDVVAMTPGGSLYSPYTINISNALYLPTPGNHTTGSVVNFAGSPPVCDGATRFCPAVTFERNTFPTSNLFSVAGLTGENNDGAAGIYSSIQSNIAWVPDNTNGYITNWLTANTPVAGLYTTVDYNWAYNFLNANRYSGYPTGNPDQYTNAPGVHDTTGDPLFVDPTRNIITFGQLYNPAITTIHEVSVEIRKVFGKEAGYDTRFNLEDMYNWIRAGFAPTNPLTRTAGSDGGIVGAVAYVDTTDPTVSVTSPTAASTVSGTISVTSTATDDVGISGVQFKLDDAILGAEVTSASPADTYTYSWDTTTATNASHSLVAVARDAAGNISTSSAISFTVSNIVPDTTPPVISVVASSTTSSAATITWTTGEASDSQVNYGLTSSYTASSTLDSSSITSHSVSLSGLADNTIYHFRVRSTDASNNLAVSGDYTFLTEAIVVADTNNNVSTSNNTNMSGGARLRRAGQGHVLTRETITQMQKQIFELQKILISLISQLINLKKSE